MDSSIVMFAIESGVKLGFKLNDVLVDSTRERPLPLPVGELFGDLGVVEANTFFRAPENSALVAAGGPFHGLGNDGRVEAYRRVLALGTRAGGTQAAADAVMGLHAFEQLEDSFGAQHPAKRVLGSLVEVGIDYFSLRPEALGHGSPGRKVLQAFIEALDDTDFAEGTPDAIVSDLMVAAVQTLDGNVSLIDEDPKVQALLGGVTSALLEDAEGLSQGAKVSREAFFRRVGASVLRGGAGAFTENVELFVRDDRARTLVHSTLSQVLEGIRGKEDLFSNDSLELLVTSALTAVGENAELFSDQKVVQELIGQTVTALTNTQGRKLFSQDTVAAVVQVALETARDNVDTLIDPDDPQRQLLASAVGSVARSLASSLAGGGTLKDLLSKRQVMELVSVVFAEVAENPERLLGADPSDERKTALAQVIGSVARALGDDPSRFVNGDGVVELVEIALAVSVRNVDKLLTLDSQNINTNPLFKALKEITDGILDAGDPRELLDRRTYLEMVERVLPLVSANVDAFLQGSVKKVKESISTALRLARGELAGRINGANLPQLVEGLLEEVLWDELKLDEHLAVVREAERILRAA